MLVMQISVELVITTLYLLSLTSPTVLASVASANRGVIIIDVNSRNGRIIAFIIFLETIKKS